MTPSRKKDNDAAMGDGTPPDAIKQLKADHDNVRRLFREFETLKGSDEQDERKAELVDEICYELTLHTMLEEELFYPAVREAIDNDELMDEADVEHAGAKDLVSQLEVMYPGDDHFDASVAVLSEEMEHHIEREESEIFPAARKAKLDLKDLGEQLSTRKQELEEDLAAPPAPPTRGAGGRRPSQTPD